MLLLSTTAGTTASHAASAVTTVPDVSVGHAILQMVLALAVIVGSILVLTKFLRRLRGGPGASRPGRGGRGARGGADARDLVVLSRQSLGKDLAIAAVRWGGREVLVGIAGSTITFLDDARSEEPAASPAVASLTAPVAGAAPSFPDLQPAPGPMAPAAFSPAMLAAARQGLPALVAPAPDGRPSLLDQLRAATVRR